MYFKFIFVSVFLSALYYNNNINLALLAVHCIVIAGYIFMYVFMVMDFQRLGTHFELLLGPRIFAAKKTSEIVGYISFGKNRSKSYTQAIFDIFVGNCQIYFFVFDFSVKESKNRRISQELIQQFEIVLQFRIFSSNSQGISQDIFILRSIDPDRLIRRIKSLKIIKYDFLRKSEALVITHILH